ncbi:hypothetical protein [Legionella nagasakiensis]|uniref:hypothetical protein n=1 Tax=Legionella nagasakiensis TaxID=535290 RepID=UPI001F5F4DC3|nr:hypothetical protein [Legionella nagasakiensis]
MWKFISKYSRLIPTNWIGKLIVLMMAWPASLFANDTELLFYRPFAETSHHPTLIIDRKTSGFCRQQSQLIVREDAWKCMAEGKIYDPCFVKRFGLNDEAVCTESPWSGHGIKITVNYPLDDSMHEKLDISNAYPWAVELVDGEQCLAVTTDDMYDGLNVRYRCNNNTSLIGRIQRCTTTWTMLQRNAQGTSTVQIAKAWF